MQFNLNLALEKISYSNIRRGLPGPYPKHAMFCRGHTELSNNYDCVIVSAAVAVTCKKDVEMGLCMLNFVCRHPCLCMPIYTLFEYFLA